MVKNVIEDVVVPESPKVLPNEQLHVYVPMASNNQKGIAKFNEGAFEVVDGEVKLKEKYLNDVGSKSFLSKSNLPNKIYGTNDSGEDVNVPYSVEAVANNIVKRSNSGDVIVPSSTTDVNAAVCLGQLKEGLSKNVPVVKDDTLDEKFLYSYFYDKYGKSRLIKADSELDSELAVRLRDGHLRVPYNPSSRFTVDTAVNSKYLLDNYKTANETEAADICSFDIEQAKDEDGKHIFGVYNFKITLNNGSVFTKELDLPLEAVQIASVNDYVGEDDKRYLEIRFVDENVTPIVVKFDEIFNLDNLVKNEVYIGPGAPTGDETLWVDTAAKGAKNQPYDVEIKLDDGDVGYARLTIDGIQKGADSTYVFRLVSRYCEDDLAYRGGACVVTVCPDTPAACSVDISNSAAPTHFAVVAEKVYLYIPKPSCSDYSIFVKGLTEVVTGASAERVETLPKNAEAVICHTLSPNEATYSATPSKIVRRNSVGEILLPNRTTYSSNGAVPYSFVDKLYARKAKVEIVSDRVAFLEGALLEYVEDTSAAYEKQIPEGVASKAILNSAQGSAAVVGKNLFNPAAYGYTINEDGSFSISGDNGEGGYSDIFAENILLDKGTYYVSVSHAGSSGDNNIVDMVEVQSEYIDFDGYRITVLQSDFIYLRIGADGYGPYDINVYVMLTRERNAPFEPYGGVGSVLTSVDVISPNLLDYTKLLPATDLIENGIRITDYYMYSMPSFAELKQLLGVSAGDVITVSAKVQVHDISGNYNGTPIPYLCYEGPEQSFRIDFRESGDTVTIPEDFDYGFEYITSGLDLSFTGGSNGSYVDVTDIMVVKGDKKASYVPYSTEPISTFEIPNGIQSIAEQNIGCVIDFTNKCIVAGKTTIDISQHLNDYTDYKFIDVLPSGLIRFNNEAKADFQSTVTYVKPKGGA